MIKVLYYSYYLFYTKIIPDNEPHATTIFTLSFTESLIANGIINICLVFSLNTSLNKWIMVLLFLLVLVFNYLFFNKNERGKKIVERDKPLLCNSKVLSVSFAFFIFLLGLLCMFFVPIISRTLLEN
jgi:Ca2+/Na+ antiporter